MLLGMDFGPEMAANKPATLLGMDFGLEMTANEPYCSVAEARGGNPLKASKRLY
jgi:hypothetical protein